MSNFQVVRVAPNGDRKILNTVSKKTLKYKSIHPSYNGRKLDSREARRGLAIEIADDWQRCGPWTDCAIVVEEV